MIRKTVKFSSVIKALNYDPISMLLTVETHSGREYTYEGITSEEAQAFMDAPSKGKYWNEFRKRTNP